MLSWRSKRGAQPTLLRGRDDVSDRHATILHARLPVLPPPTTMAQAHKVSAPTTRHMLRGRTTGC
eukprot:scaffold155445_cov31-Tisochrysis_lutea.AAC.3